MTGLNIKAEKEEYFQLLLEDDEAVIVMGVLNFLEDYLSCQTKINTDTNLDIKLNENNYHNATIYGLSRLAIIDEYGRNADDITIDSINATSGE